MKVVVESMREALDVLEDVEKVYDDMKGIADHGAFIGQDPYEFTRALGVALGLEPDE